MKKRRTSPSTAFPQATAKNREIRLFFAGHCSGRLQLAMSLTITQDVRAGEKSRARARNTRWR